MEFNSQKFIVSNDYEHFTLEQEIIMEDFSLKYIESY